jgi:hypothetical protein
MCHFHLLIFLQRTEIVCHSHIFDYAREKSEWKIDCMGLFAFIFLSNHFTCSCGTTRDSSQSSWATFQGNLARSVNIRCAGIGIAIG